MSTEQALQFMEKSAKDEALQQQLQNLIGTGDGNISTSHELDASEAAALKGSRGTQVVELAAKNGFEFSVDELANLINLFEKHQSGEISEAEFTNFINSFPLSQQTKDRLVSGQHSVNLFVYSRRSPKVVTKSAPSTPSTSIKATAKVVQFMEKTADDETLQQELKTILGVGDGDISSIDELDADEAYALKSPKNASVIKLAAQYGFEFAAKDLLIVLALFNQQKFGAISRDDFAQLTGTSALPKETNKPVNEEVIYLGRRYRKTTLPNGELKIEYIDNKQMRAAKSTAVIEFMLKTAEDAALKQEVKKVLGVGDGDISTITELDPAEANALKGDLGSAVSELAATSGFQFSTDDLSMVVETFEQRQAGKISQKEFAQRTGLSELEKQSGEGLSLWQKAVNFFSGKRSSSHGE